MKFLNKYPNAKFAIITAIFTGNFLAWFAWTDTQNLLVTIIITAVITTLTFVAAGTYSALSRIGKTLESFKAKPTEPI